MRAANDYLAVYLLHSGTRVIFSADCGDGYYNSRTASCNVLGIDAMSWQEAVDFCATYGGSLWRPRTKGNSDFLFSMVKEIQELEGEWYLVIVWLTVLHSSPQG